MIVLETQVPLAPLTTFGIGGPARLLGLVRTEPELVEGLAVARAERLPVLVLGGGSNLLVRDEGFPGVVLRMAPGGEIHEQDGLVSAPAGMEWDALVKAVCERGLAGMECLAGIPGLVGASPIQNIGAYGQDVAQTIESVRAYDRREERFTTLEREQCGFAYRTSLFNTTERGRYVLTEVRFAMRAGGEPNLGYADLKKYFAGRPAPGLMEVYRGVREIREAKGMLLSKDGGVDTRSAGSFFKNPMVPVGALARIAEVLGMREEEIPRYPGAQGQAKLPAAWLLERAGFGKGYALGAAGISTRHTLALVNRGGARYADIAKLRDRIKETVEERFGIRLEQEPVEPEA